MTISNQPASLLESVLQAQATRADISISMLEKAQDLETQQGAAMVDMLEKSVPPVSGQYLDTYA
jgi:hypothetical protein